MRHRTHQSSGVGLNGLRTVGDPETGCAVAWISGPVVDANDSHVLHELRRHTAARSDPRGAEPSEPEDRCLSLYARHDFQCDLVPQTGITSNFSGHQNLSENFAEAGTDDGPVDECQEHLYDILDVLAEWDEHLKQAGVTLEDEELRL